mmetsp:Transcript_23040/g.78810  ORF Transcript_23040/g.78810 Transcript_23040/m.78810 type:complete len:369 (+) Transcript_23040:812-1918(+)
MVVIRSRGLARVVVRRRGCASRAFAARVVVPERRRGSRAFAAREVVRRGRGPARAFARGGKRGRAVVGHASVRAVHLHSVLAVLRMHGVHGVRRVRPRRRLRVHRLRQAVRRRVRRHRRVPLRRRVVVARVVARVVGVAARVAAVERPRSVQRGLARVRRETREAAAAAAVVVRGIGVVDHGVARVCVCAVAARQARLLRAVVRAAVVAAVVVARVVRGLRRGAHGVERVGVVAVGVVAVGLVAVVEVRRGARVGVLPREGVGGDEVRDARATEAALALARRAVRPHERLRGALLLRLRISRRRRRVRRRGEPRRAEQAPAQLGARLAHGAMEGLLGEAQLVDERVVAVFDYADVGPLPNGVLAAAFF